MCLSVIEKLAQNKQQAAYIISQGFDVVVIQIIQKYLVPDQTSVSNEVCQMACNLLAGICIAQPKHSIVLLDYEVLDMLMNVINTTSSQDTARFALSAFIEILYANKGNKYQNIIAMLLTMKNKTVDQIILQIMGLYPKFKNDCESLIVWATIMRIIASVPKKEDQVREILLTHKYLSILMDMLSDPENGLQQKCALLDAMDAVLCI